MSNLTYDEAKKAEGQTFKIVTADNYEVELTLQRVMPRDSARGNVPGGTRDPFTLIFKGAPGHYCEQDTYTLQNQTLGNQQIFIVPVECDGATETYTYQAVFN